MLRVLNLKLKQFLRLKKCPKHYFTQFTLYAKYGKKKKKMIKNLSSVYIYSAV